MTTKSLKVQQPFLVNLNTLGQELTPATAELKAALPVINPAIEAGTKTLARTPVLNANLQQVLDALKNLSLAPGTNMAVNALTSTVTTLNPMVKYLGPVPDRLQRLELLLDLPVRAPVRADELRLCPAGADQPGQPGPAQQRRPAGRRRARSTAAAPKLALATGGNEFLHSQAYGAAINSAGNADCETGQRGYVKKLNFFDPQGRNLAVDAHTPGNQGPTFTGRAHVPKGETFSRNPLTGPQLTPVPGNS